MKTIINDNFMLNTQTAVDLYESYAKDMPIIDYHCHLVPQMIATDYRFDNVGELMLGGDHYKWRAMRSFGIDEKYITGDATWREKFKAFATMLPYAAGNPLYHWTHLELKRYFGIDEILTEESADRIFDKCNELLATDGFSAKGLISRSGVEVVCTTDDPADTLEWHKIIRESGFSTKVLPTFRPDKAVSIHKDTFLPYIKSIGVSSYAELKNWLISRIDFFHKNGCRISDHGLDFIPYAKGNANEIFNSVLNGHTPTQEEAWIYITDLLVFCGKEYAKRNWCMQIHVGATRNNNSLMYNKLGPDTGYDAIGDSSLAVQLSKIMDEMECEDLLPKTILYSLNPNDTYALATLMGCFQKAPFRSKIQLGSGWWFNDQRDGMEAQLKALGNLGILGAFVGMLTDSRSLVSYPRHEYFRRILCNILGTWVENGEYPDDREALSKIIKGICYENAKEYFRF